MKIKYQLNQLKEISLKVTQNFNKKIVLISGEMGAGKTTLIKEILIGLNVIDNISSPTFSIINEYKTKTLVYGGEQVNVVSGRFPCTVCSKGVGANSALFSSCKKWCHRRCSDVSSSSRFSDSNPLVCTTCLNPPSCSCEVDIFPGVENFLRLFAI